MKLATLRNGHRDGLLVVVDKTLTRMAGLPDNLITLQQALDNWQHYEPLLQTIYEQLNAGIFKNALKFNAQDCLAPLPRAFQFVDGSAYLHHIELVRKSRGAEMPQKLWEDPLMYQGCSDTFLSATDPIVMASTDWGIDLEAEVAVITDDVPMGVSVEQAAQHIKLILLLNDVSLRNLIPAELEKGFGFVQSKPASSFSPVTVTPQELGSAWDGKKLHLPLQSYINEQKLGEPNAGQEMIFNFPQLIAHAAKSRRLCAGTIVGSGTVSNKDRSKGSSCLVEKRTLEILDAGKAVTPYLQFGDVVRIEMHDEHGQNIFGSIHQKVQAYQP